MRHIGSTVLALSLASSLATMTTGCFRSRDIGNTLRVVLVEKYKTIDPAHATDHYSGILVRRTYEGLFQYHYLKRPYEIEPLLAESLPSVSSDGLTYTFKIKKGVYFHDDKAFTQTKGKGRELTAEDFVYSFKRIIDPNDVSEGFWTFDGRLVGIDAWRDQAKKTGKTDFNVPLEGAKAVDRYTLQLKLVKPDPMLLHVLTMSYGNVVAREVVEHYGKEFPNHPVGTGPFMLERLSPNQVTWVRNPNFHGEQYPKEGSAGDREAGLLADAGKPLPFVDKIVDDVLIEEQPQWLNFMQGNHDYMRRVPQDNTSMVWGADHKPRAELRDKNIAVHVTPGDWFYYIAFNMDDPVVGGEKNKYLRKAMSMAFDEVPAIEKFYLGLAIKAESPIPPGIAGYDPNYKNPSRQYNLQKAREMLAKAGHPNGEGLPELVFDVRAATAVRQFAEYFQRSMEPLGIKIRINSLSWPELLGRIRKKQSQFWSISWLYDYPDAENGWQLLYGKNESPGSNEANYKNPKFDELYRKIAVMKNGPERNALFAKMRDIFAEDVPWIITVHPSETRLVQPWLSNFKIHTFEHNIDKYLRVNPEARKKALQ